MKPKALLKKATKNKTVKQFFSENWEWILIAVVAALVIALVVWLLLRRRKKRRALQAVDTPGVQAPKLDLHRIWKRFLRQMPGALRRALPLYRPVIVLGSGGAGKTTLVDRRTDWYGQAAQFLPSYRDDPRLQIYKASGSIVMELGASVLNDASRAAFKALTRLWRKLRRWKSARAVVVLNVQELEALEPDAITRQAQLVRGKLNALRLATGKPVEVCVALTHMDRLDGYAELAEVFRSHQRPFGLETGDEPTAADVAGAVGQIEPFLTDALTSGSADDYLRILSLLGDLPPLLARVQGFLVALQEPDPHSASPYVSSVGLTSREDTVGAESWNPFYDAITAQEATGFRPELKHRVAAAALAAVGCLVVAAAYFGERETFVHAAESISSFRENSIEPASRDKLLEFADESRKRADLATLSPWFFDDADLLRRFIAVRLAEGPVAYLRGELDRLSEAPCPEDLDADRVLHMLMLLRASEGSRTAEHIRSNVRHWARRVGLSVESVEDILASSALRADDPRPLAPEVFAECFPAPPLPGTLDENPERLLVRASAAIQGDDHSRGTLEGLKELGESVARELATVDRLTAFLRFLDRVQAVLGDTYTRAWRENGLLPELPGSDPDDIRGVIQTLRALDLAVPRVEHLVFADLSGVLRGLAPEGPELGSRWSFVVNGELIEFSPTDLKTLARGCVIEETLAAFESGSDRTGAALFFGPNDRYRGVNLNVGRRGLSFFAEDAKVDGIYTASAYKDKVKPVLDGLPGLLSGLPIQQAKRQQFLDYVTDAVSEYAADYVQAYEDLYKGFGYEAVTSLSLQQSLTQLIASNSPLAKMLREISKNTALEVDRENSLYEHVAPIPDTFSFLWNILPQTGGEAPVFDGFFALVSELRQAITSSEPPPESEDGGPSLAADLSPLGRMSLSVFLGEEGAFFGRFESWAAEAQLPSEWDEPFLGVSRQAYQIGIDEVEARVAVAWENLAAEHLAPLGGRYPFERSAETAVTPAELENALAPTGPFWTGFEGTIGPVCVRRRSGWKRRSSPYGRVHLPSGMLPLVRKLDTLTELLWNGDGEPTPLVIKARPGELPTPSLGQWQLVVGFLQMDEKTVFGFNQRPGWTTVEIKWWERGSSSVGAGYSPDGSDRRKYRSVSAQDMDWSLFRLLDIANDADDSRASWSWNVPTPVSGRNVTVGFGLDEDPRAPFEIDLPKAPRSSRRRGR